MNCCKTCGLHFDWGWDSVTERWVPLEPVATHDDLQKSFVDETGLLRADHRDRHAGISGVNVMRLGKKVPATDPEILEPEPAEPHPPKPPTKRRRKAA